MKKSLPLYSIFVIILIAGTVSYFYFLAPTADQLRVSTMTGDDKDIDAALIAATNAQYGDTASLVAKKDSYYEFGMSQSNEPGGIELIAYRKSDGVFEVVWKGQDSPRCSELKGYAVPAGIVGACYSGLESDLKTVDRSNWVRSIVSEYIL